jgi:hypothetical protein
MNIPLLGGGLLHQFFHKALEFLYLIFPDQIFGNNLNHIRPPLYSRCLEVLKCKRIIPYVAL